MTTKSAEFKLLCGVESNNLIALHDIRMSFEVTVVFPNTRCRNSQEIYYECV